MQSKCSFDFLFSRIPSLSVRLANCQVCNQFLAFFCYHFALATNVALRTGPTEMIVQEQKMNTAQQCTKYFINGIDYILNIDFYADKFYACTTNGRNVQQKKKKNEKKWIVLFNIHIEKWNHIRWIIT